MSPLFLLLAAALQIEAPSDGGGFSFVAGETIGRSEVNSRRHDLRLCDLDGDGDLDFVTVHGPQTWPPGPSDRVVQTHVNDGRGGILSTNACSIGADDWAPEHLDAADMDGDGDGDLLVSGRLPADWLGGRGFLWQVRLYRNDGRRGFVQVWASEAMPEKVVCVATWLPGEPPRSFLVPGGTPDEVLRLTASATGVARREEAWCVPAELRRRLVDDSPRAWCDYDGDGRLEVALGGAFMVPGTVILSMDEEARVFVDRTASVLPEEVQRHEAGDLAWSDLDGDGAVDLVIAGYGSPPDGDPEIFLRNSGDGCLEWIREALPSTWWTRQVVGCDMADFDLDGDLDVFFLGMVSTAGYLAENVGGFRFRPQRVQGSAGFVWANGGDFAAGDLDGDGDRDLVGSGVILNEVR